MQNAQQEQDLGRLRQPGGADRNSLDRAALVSAPSKSTQHLKGLLTDISSNNFLKSHIWPISQGIFGVLIVVS